MGSDILTLEFMILIAVGFLAQIVDGTLGMAFPTDDLGRRP
jgi:hypothetical protein